MAIANLTLRSLTELAGIAAIGSAGNTALLFVFGQDARESLTEMAR